jgi:ATP-dependent exoDNAse (exonuclease V) beta subunit
MSTPAPDQLERDRATDIHRSVIVQAPAGSGKTSLLVSRFLKLLCVVEKPEEILAITFTRKAASEMANRILTALESAAHGHQADADASRALARSRERGWRLLEVPARSAGGSGAGSGARADGKRRRALPARCEPSAAAPLR